MATVLERFNSGWTPEPYSGCWLWTRCCNRHGYGVMSIDDKLNYLHRLSWQLHRGEIPKGMYVLHCCDTPPCVNPDHLFLGTHLDNVRDAAKKGRMSRGEKRWKAKLTESDVRAIRASDKPYAELSATFNTTESNICLIKRRRNWKHI